MSVRFAAPRRPVGRVFLHCSASDSPAHDNLRTIELWHTRRGFSGCGYHYFVRKDGTLERGRDLERDPAAQAGHNRGTIAVCLHGLAGDRFTEHQFATLRALCQSIHEQLPLATFHGHCEVSAKSCPVFPYRAVLNLDARGRMLA